MTDTPLRYLDNYFDRPEYLTAFKSYARDIFDLNFTRWEERGCWDREYIAFSAFDHRTCVASMCVYPSEVIIFEKAYRAVQLLTVGTRPSYRHRGIQRRLWENVRRWVRENGDFCFLFADNTAAGFYRKLGLRQMNEYSFRLETPLSSDSSTGNSRLLNPRDDQDFILLRRLAETRKPVSEKLGVLNPRLLLFMILYPYMNSCYYLEDLDAAVIIEQNSNSIAVNDIISADMPLLKDIASFLAGFGKRTIEFRFCPDLLQPGKISRHPISDDLLFVSPEYPGSSELLFPYSCRA